MKNICSVILFVFIAVNMIAQTSESNQVFYTHQSKQSLMAKNFKMGASLFLPKNSLKKNLSKPNFASEAAAIPKKYFKEFNISISIVKGRNVYEIAPKSNKSGKCILYLHGGAYINNVMSAHWDFVALLVRETGCVVVLPDYHLAPNSTYVDAFAMIDELYSIILNRTDSDNVIFCGDSAGGGFALAFVQKLKSEGVAMPQQLILISPWLDVSMCNPEIEVVQKKDPILNAETLILAGKAWAGNADTKNYLVSPIYGDLSGLPKISIFIGSDDILYPDCEKFKSLISNQSSSFNYFEYPKMFHVWVLFPFLKESKCATQQICDLINE
ncbi:MAG: alpha/beta hydrolase [Bacteroidales bacterium]|nr:alpha/beta hydrolase [Bacteroidales bacterium]